MKRERLQRMHAMLQGAGDLDLSRFIATIEYQMGLTPIKAREYLGVLERLGLVEVDETIGLIREVVKK
jgi:hypothetical protein